MKLEWTNRMKHTGSHYDWVEHVFGLATVFDGFGTRGIQKPSFTGTGVSTPAVNVMETSDDFRLEMIAPGMKRKNFTVELQNDVLTIYYENNDNREGNEKGWFYTTHEHNYHSFARSFSLPESADSEKINARYEDGILSLVIPKKPGSKSPTARQIQVL